MKQLLNFILVFLIAFMQVPLANAQFTPAQEQALEIEYLKNGGFENGVSGWKAYKDAAQATLVDATGGTPAISIASSTSSPIQGKASGVITKTASNLQGEGISKTFTLDKSMRGKMVRITGSYEIVSGTYSGGTPSTDSDIVVGIYDVDAGAYIQPSAYKLDGSVSGMTYPLNVEFQPRNLTSVNYRLAFHVATTSASAYSLRIDELKVGKHSMPTGAAISSTLSWSPSAVALTSGSITNATSVGVYRRSADRAYVSVMTTFSSPSAAFSGFRMSLPPGCTLDTAKIPNDVSVSKSLNSSVTLIDGGVSHYGIAGKVKVISGDTSNVEVVWSTTNYAQASITNTSPFTFAGGDSVSMDFDVPCVGWGSPALMSDSANTRPVYAKYSLTSDETTAANADHIMTNFTTKQYDSHGAMSGSTYTAKIPGVYTVRLKAITNSQSWTTSDIIGAYLAKNGGTQTEFIVRQKIQAAFTERLMLFGETSTYLNAGDTVQINIRNTTSGTVPVIASAISYLEIEMVNGPSQIQASESVSWAGRTATGVSIGTGVTDISFGTEDEDSHGAYNTSNGMFTAPTPGMYEITAQISFTSQSWTVGSSYTLRILIDGSTTYLSEGIIQRTATQQPAPVFITQKVRLKSGQTVNFASNQSESGAGRNLISSGAYNFASIQKVGN